MKKLITIGLLALFSFPSFVLAEGTTVNNGDMTTPIGTISVYAGIESSTQLLERGYLIADGSSLLRSQYPDLFAVIGTTYGNVDSTHFNLPNLKGRTVVGMDESDNDFKTLGKTGGQKEVTLTVDQIPSHTHTFTGTSTTTAAESNSHTHTFSGTVVTKTLTGTLFTWSDQNYASSGIVTSDGEMKWAAPGSGTQMGGANYVINATHTHTFSGTTLGASTTHTHTVKPTGTNAKTGGSKAHNNLQPYIALKYVIKVK